MERVASPTGLYVPSIERPASDLQAGKQRALRVVIGLRLLVMIRRKLLLVVVLWS